MLLKRAAACLVELQVSRRKAIDSGSHNLSKVNVVIRNIHQQPSYLLATCSLATYHLITAIAENCYMGAAGTNSINIMASIFCRCTASFQETSSSLFERRAEDLHLGVQSGNWPQGGTGTETLPFICSYHGWAGMQGYKHTHGYECTAEVQRRSQCTHARTHTRNADNGFLDSLSNCAGMPEEERKREQKKQECCCKDIISIVCHAGKVVATQNGNDS